MLMRVAAAAIVLSLLGLAGTPVAYGQTAAPAPSAPVAPADQACDANKLSTNAYEDCLQQAETKFDSQLTALLKSIPASATVKNNVLAPDVAASAKQLWQKNFAAMAPAFRAYRDADCEDDSVVAVGYGNGGLQWRLACQINETSHEIDKLKKRYSLN